MIDRGPQFKADSYISILTWIHQGAVGSAIRDIVKHEEGTTARASPHVEFHHAGFAFSPGFTGHQETKIPFWVFVGVVVIQFKGTGWIHFSPHQLLDLHQPKLLEGKGRIGHITVVGLGIQQAHDQTIGDAFLKQIAFVEFQLIGGLGKHTNLTTHGRVLGQFTSAVSRRVQGLVQRSRQGQLTDMKGHLQILGGQTSV